MKMVLLLTKLTVIYRWLMKRGAIAKKNLRSKGFRDEGVINWKKFITYQTSKLIKKGFTPLLRRVEFLPFF